MLAEKPGLARPFYGVVELQLAVLPYLVSAFEKQAQGHPVLQHLRPFADHVARRVVKQSQELGFYPKDRPGAVSRYAAMASGGALFVRSQFARSHSTLDKTYLRELGFGGGASPAAPGAADGKVAVDGA